MSEARKMWSTFQRQDSELIPNYSIALAFELLPPTRVCFLFSHALNRKVTYQFSPSIDVEVSVPDGYREQLEALEVLFGNFRAPYFGLDLESGENTKTVEDGTAKGSGTVVEEARTLWGGWRGMEEYAREVFPVEEFHNGLTWMEEEATGESEREAQVAKKGVDKNI